LARRNPFPSPAAILERLGFGLSTFLPAGEERRKARVSSLQEEGLEGFLPLSSRHQGSRRQGLAFQTHRRGSASSHRQAGRGTLVRFPSIPITENRAVEVNVGLKTFAMLSDGTEIENPRFLAKALAKLRKAQRRLCRKVKGSMVRNRHLSRAISEDLMEFNKEDTVSFPESACGRVCDDGFQDRILQSPRAGGLLRLVLHAQSSGP